MCRCFLVGLAVLLICVCAYEDPESNSSGIADDEDDAFSVTGELGHPLHVRCLTSEKPILFVWWYQGNRRNTWLHNDLVYGMTGNALLIRSLAIETLGQYTCQAYSSEGMEAPRVINVRAYMPEGLFIENEWLVSRHAVASIPDTTTATLGDLATAKREVAVSESGVAILPCQFDSTKFHIDPSTKITWKLGEHKIDGTRGRYRLMSDGSLEIVSLYRNDTGVYICLVDNGVEVATQEIHLIVNGPVRIPAEIAGEDNATVTAELDQSLLVRCLAYGYPKPSVFWTRGYGGGIVLYNDSIYEVTENVLTIRSLRIDTLGPYTCRAYNGARRVASWEVIVRAYRPEGIIIENKWLVPRETLAHRPATQPSITTDIWLFTDEVYDCNQHLVNCSHLRCEYGIQRVRQPDGCEQCSCMQVEIDCEPLKQECRQIKCNYGIERVTGPEGCERCKCKEHPCGRTSCAVGERCVVHQYQNELKTELQFTTECRTIVKTGACPMNETTTTEVSCRRECVDDADCQGVGKCCRRGCSGICLVPVEHTSPHPSVTTTIAPNPVKIPVAIVGVQNATVIGELGQPLSVSCLADGYPPPAVFWYFGYEDAMVPYYNTDYLVRANILFFKNLSIENLGQYTCHAYNGGDKEATWSVIVQAYKPDGLFMENEFIVHRTKSATAAETTTKTWTITEPFTLLLTVPVSAHMVTPFSTLNIGADLHLTCEVDGLPEPDVHWTKDGANIQPDARISVTGSTAVSQLTVARVTVADSGLYACHANNPYSSQSDTAQINVQQLIVPAKCTDNPFFAPCDLIVRSKFCRHKYYSKFCCKSCVEAGQLDAQDFY